MPKMTSLVESYLAGPIVGRLGQIRRTQQNWRVKRGDSFGHNTFIHPRTFKATVASQSASSSMSIFGKGISVIETQATTSKLSMPYPEEHFTVHLIKSSDAMKPNGPAVEKIHGRLAMAMFIPAVIRETSTTETLFQQLQHPDWRLVALTIAIFYATMIPVLKDVRDEDFFWMTV